MHLLICLLLAVLSLRCFAGTTLHCGTRVSIAVAHGLGDLWASVVAAQRLVALQHMDSSWNKDWTCMPCIDRRILIHWATREVHAYAFLKQNEDPMICSFFFWLFFFFFYILGHEHAPVSLRLHHSCSNHSPVTGHWVLSNFSLF